MSVSYIHDAADELEKYICDQLKKPRPAGVLRRMKLNQLSNNINKAGEAEYNQACAFFNEHAASPSAFESSLGKLQARGDTAHKQFLAMLHVLATDPELEALRNLQADSTSGRHGHPVQLPQTSSSSTLSQGPQQGLSSISQHTTQQQKQLVTGQNLVPNQTLINITNTTPVLSSTQPSGLTVTEPSKINPVATASGVHKGGLTADVTSTPSSAAAAAVLARLASQGRTDSSTTSTVAAAASKRPAMRIPAAVPQSPQGLPASVAPAATGPSTASTAGGGGATSGSLLQTGHQIKPVYYGKNPIYGQQDAFDSPMVRNRNYTPSLTDSMSTRNSARSQHRLQDPHPAIPSAGDLFQQQQQHKSPATDNYPSSNTLDNGIHNEPQRNQPQPSRHHAGKGLTFNGRGAAPSSEPVTPIKAMTLGTRSTDSTAENNAAGRLLEGSAYSRIGGDGELRGREVSDLLRRMPSWNMERPYLTGQALIQHASTASISGGPSAAAIDGSSSKADSLSMMPPGLQEVAVINDLLYAFMGHGGTYIKARLIPPATPLVPEMTEELRPGPHAVMSSHPTNQTTHHVAGPTPDFAQHLTPAPAPPGAVAAGATGEVRNAATGSTVSSTPIAGSLGGGETSGRPTLTFVVDADLEPSLLEMVEKVLPLCEYVAVLQRFIETRSSYSYPLVFHAVTASLRGLLGDWLLLVTQLEHQLRQGQLNMQALIFHCQGPAASLKLLASVSAEAASRKLTSAGLLNLLHCKALSLGGDQLGRALMHRLLAAGCVPYFQILERWLLDGVLDDPHQEFMIQENKAISRDDLTSDGQLAFWYSRYTLRSVAGISSVETPSSSTTTPASASSQQQRRGTTKAGNDASSTTPAPSPMMANAGSPLAVNTHQEQQGAGLDVPVFLEAHADMILNTGKYLNVILECGQKPPSRASTSSSSLMLFSNVRLGSSGVPTAAATAALHFDLQGTYIQQISAAHHVASASLLKLLLGERNLLELLKSIKHYFLLDQGDVLVHLIEAAQDELSKPTRDISTTRLQSLLEMAVKTSSAASDPLSDNLSFEMDPRSVVELAKVAARQARAAALAGRAGKQIIGSDGDVVSGGGTTIRLQLPHDVLKMNAANMVSSPSASISSNLKKLLQRQPMAQERDKEDKPAWEFFVLSYRVAWPHSLVVPPSQLANYQLVFKLLLTLKLTERQLSTTWLRMAGRSRALDKAAVSARIGGPDGRRAEALARFGKESVVPVGWDVEEMYRVYSLGQRLLYFVQEFLRYSTFDVLEALWSRMEAGIRKAQDVDQVVGLHRRFLDRARSGLLLSHDAATRLMSSFSRLAQAYCTSVNSVLDAALQQSSGGKAVGGSLGTVTTAGAGSEDIVKMPSHNRMHDGSSDASRTVASATNPGKVSSRGLQGGALRVRLEEAAPSGALGSLPSSSSAAAAAAGLKGEAGGNLDEDSSSSMAGMSALFDGHVEELISELKRMYEIMMKQGGAEGVTDGMLLEDLAESREELERMQSLIERLGAARSSSVSITGNIHNTSSQAVALAQQALLASKARTVT
ncbi:hypothetical protein CEUSTIGMA_g65.t1 [Chlamydomonas eustigma]|uniref:Gamma-tubulin complex component n=1 Tax=Chlamydomonas eustigma TaxID=1157962 RepID=A0A250WPJ2_9CHLO|nr:hypothetical protein CEUSTIGMA_g65.t1 [Chlamydomonas eustigma]|eukprot:GAX72609.1 hypothetical protein CEUSTIGMA_g65.t1 [Chlamydomonas eustigma]